MIKLFRIMLIGEAGWTVEDRGIRDSVEQARRSIQQDVLTIPEEKDHLGAHLYYVILRGDDMYKYLVDVALVKGNYKLHLTNQPNLTFPDEVLLELMKIMGRSPAGG